mmetsp:Transcript_33181/g.72373  ORF Transcript_33181/g.72373 Transcript_33181/m.72373 type:complete len:277 (+) Transcript_33181:47-877(+)
MNSQGLEAACRQRSKSAITSGLLASRHARNGTPLALLQGGDLLSNIGLQLQHCLVLICELIPVFLLDLLELYQLCLERLELGSPVLDGLLHIPDGLLASFFLSLLSCLSLLLPLLLQLFNLPLLHGFCLARPAALFPRSISHLPSHHSSHQRGTASFSPSRPVGRSHRSRCGHGFQHVRKTLFPLADPGPRGRWAILVAGRSWPPARREEQSLSLRSCSCPGVLVPALDDVGLVVHPQQLSSIVFENGELIALVHARGQGAGEEVPPIRCPAAVDR